MLLQRKNGYVGLPSVSSHSSRCLRRSSPTESPGPSGRSSTRNHRSFASPALGWRSTEKFLSPAKEVARGTSGSPELQRRPGRELGWESLSPVHPRRDWSTTTQLRSGIGFSASAESSGGHSHSATSRRHSLTRLPAGHSGASGPMEPSARRRRSVSEQDLRTCLLERVRKEAELAALLKEAHCAPKGEMEELKKLEVDLNTMKFELLFLKQRMESSFVVLEREKVWLEMLSSGGRKRKWKRKEKIFPLTTDLPKAKSCLGRRRNGPLSQDFSQNEDAGKKDVSRDTPALQENQLAQKDGIQALEEEQEATAQQMTSAQEAGRELPLEVAESCQTLEASTNSLHHSEAEKTQKKLGTCLQALENERVLLLGEREGRILEGQLDGPCGEEELQALQVACENLRESQSLLQREKDLLETRCLELEAALQGQREEAERHLAEQVQVSHCWRDRWEQAAAALKSKEEELEEAYLQSQASSAQLETALLLRNQLEACQQELALERNRSQAPDRYVQRRESGSQTSAVPPSETAQEETDTEVALVREELRKVWDALKSRDAELEGKQLELETARNQYAKCNLEKQSLDHLVASLEEQLAEREQALRRLEEAGDEERAEKEMKISLLEQKLAEMEAAQDLPRHESNTALETIDVRGSVAGEDGGSREPCHHCSAALAQLSQAIQSAEKREQEDQTLACLYRLRDLLKGSLSDRAPVPKPVQSPNRDPAAKVTRSPQEEKEILRQRHQLVTEQLKGLFRQRQQLEQSKKHLRGGKEERPPEPQKSQEVLAAPESSRPTEEQPGAPDVPSNSAEVQRLQQLLKEQTETISSMGSEIQALQHKNESLMKAKLRFQQQIQQIRNLPKQRPERSPLELPVPRLSVTLGQDSHSAQGSDSSVPSPQSDEPPFAGSREDLSQALPWSQPRAGTEDQQKGGSPDQGAGEVIRSPPSPPIPIGSSSKPSSLERLSPLPVDSEGALASPRGSVLLSPRPFGPPRPWSPFKFGGSPELPEGREKH